MTVLDAAPLNCPRSLSRDRWTGNILIFSSLFLCGFFLFALWVQGWDWYYVCMVPALLPTGIGASYWIWLTSQYFRYA